MKRMAIAVFGLFAGGPALAETNLHYYAQEGDRAGVEKELRKGVAVPAGG